jgi:hypothetical protein
MSAITTKRPFPNMRFQVFEGLLCAMGIKVTVQRQRKAPRAATVF